jgi:hypothetical protein
MGPYKLSSLDLAMQKVALSLIFVKYLHPASITASEAPGSAVLSLHLQIDHSCVVLISSL